MATSTQPATNAGILTITTDDLSKAIDAAITRALSHEGTPGGRKNAALNAAAAALAGPRTNWGGLRAKDTFISNGARANQSGGRNIEQPAKSSTPAPDRMVFPEFGVERMECKIEADLRALLAAALSSDQEGLLFTYTSQKWNSGSIIFNKVFIDGEGRNRALSDAPNHKDLLVAASDIEDRMNGDHGLVDWINDKFDIHEGWTRFAVLATRAGLLLIESYPSMLFTRYFPEVDDTDDMEALPALMFREAFGPMPEAHPVNDDLISQHGQSQSDDVFAWAASSEPCPDMAHTDALRRGGLTVLAMQNPSMAEALRRASRAIEVGKGLAEECEIKRNEIHHIL